MTRVQNYIRINRWTRIVLLVLAWVLLPLPSSALTKDNGDAAYKKGNFQQAITDYKGLLRNSVSPEIYYNLGNAYFRSDSLAQAILAYERAHRLSPGDKDINFNLQFARSKTIDKIVPQSEVVFATWYRSLINLTSADTWATISIIAITLALILMLVYLFGPQMTLRKVGFFGAATFLLVFALTTLFAWSQHEAITNDTGAIVISPSISVKKTPVQNAADAFVLHEGTRVEVSDSSMAGWCGVQLSDGREGWIPSRNLEKI